MRSEWPVAFVMGTAGVTINEAAHATGVANTSAVAAAAYEALIPMVALAMAQFFCYEKQSRNTNAAVLVVAIGGVLVVRAHTFQYVYKVHFNRCTVHAWAKPLNWRSQTFYSGILCY